MDYWIQRNLKAQEELTNKNTAQIKKQLTKYYQKSTKEIIGRFEKTYNKLLLSIAEGRDPTPADLYKLDTYWQSVGQLREELRKLGEKEIAELSKAFEREYFDIYYSIAIPGQVEFTQIDSAMAQQMINQIWCADGIAWSQRIWKNSELLQEALNENLIYCVITGKKTSELKNLLQEQFNVSYGRAEALVRTELAHIQTQAAEKRYKDYGIQQVEVWASKDERRCEICGKLHQKRFPIGSQMPVPAHPRCRCTIIPVVE